MKGFFSKTMIFLGIFSLLVGALGGIGISSSYAEDLELIGKDLGLIVEPSSTKLFNLLNLNPGDTQEAKIDIKNQYTSPFRLYMRTERISELPDEGEADLFQQLIITVYIDDLVVYSGPMIDFATSNVDLGRFNPNANVGLRAMVHLPGLGTGNEFQGKDVDVKWIFIAQADAPPRPESPYEPPVIITPVTPLSTVVPEEPPMEPEEPEEEVIIDAEIPEVLLI